MNAREIIKLRLSNQHLVSSKLSSVGEVVASMGAVQAQDYAMAKWAVALRMADVTDDQIEEAINRGEIFRVHILRPTWHFVSAEDIHWMMSLTAPNIRKLLASHNRQIGLDDKAITKCIKIIEKSLSDGGAKTREELVTAFNNQGIKLDNVQAGNVMLSAELDMMVCNGPRRGKQFTYSLFDARVPAVPKISRDEALYRLAGRYFSTHGPATLKDFIWWSGLSANDARMAIAANSGTLELTNVGDKDFWFKRELSGGPAKPSPLFLLPPYDEYTVAYANREFIGGSNISMTDYFGSFIFKPLVVYNGKAIGVWRREVKKQLTIDIELLVKITPSIRKAISLEVKRYQKFLDLPDCQVNMRQRM